MVWRRRGDPVEALGTVVLPSGVLVLGDMGYFNLWSGDDPPDLDHLDIGDDRLRGYVEHSVDLRIVGPDAVRAATRFDRQQGTWLYDIPQQGIDQLTASFDQIVAAAGLDASIEPEGRRVPHAERVQRAVALGGAELIVFGIPVVVVGGLPSGVELPVEGRRHDYGRIGSRWRTATLRVPGRIPHHRERIGWIGVDWARLAMASPEALAAWEHEDTLDGLADFVFWGADAARVATHFGAPRLTDDQWGWLDHDVYDVADKGGELVRWVVSQGIRLGTDFRPHSHHWEVMRQVRADPNEVGQLDLAGGRLVGLMTSWGDGIFPVTVDRDEAGTVAAVEIELGDDDRATRLQALLDG